MIQIIHLNAFHIEGMDMRLVQKDEMITTQIVVMGAMVIVQVLRQVGCVEEDQRHHKIHESFER